MCDGPMSKRNYRTIFHSILHRPASAAPIPHFCIDTVSLAQSAAGQHSPLTSFPYRSPRTICILIKWSPVRTKNVVKTFRALLRDVECSRDFVVGASNTKLCWFCALLQRQPLFIFAAHLRIAFTCRKLPAIY